MKTAIGTLVLVIGILALFGCSGTKDSEAKKAGMHELRSHLVNCGDSYYLCRLLTDHDRQVHKVFSQYKKYHTYGKRGQVSV